MTFEAIDLHRRILVASGAKVFGVIESNDVSVIGWPGVTIDTSCEAIFFGANAVDYGIVALM